MHVQYEMTAHSHRTPENKKPVITGEVAILTIFYKNMKNKTNKHVLQSDILQKQANSSTKILLNGYFGGIEV